MNKYFAKTKRKIIFTLLAVVVFAVSTSFADSLWNSKLASPYSSQKLYSEGDIITILVLETTSAAQKSGTDTQNQDNFGANFSHTIEKLNGVIAPDNSLGGGYSNKYKGAGSTTRSSNVISAVAATVVSVLPNGNLKVEAKHKVMVNEEAQYMMITGVVRPKDITGWNTVYSYQVADANIYVKGEGTASSASSPGWISRFLDWVF